MKIENELKNKQMNELYNAILKLESLKECEMFLRDIATLNELQTMSERWQVAQQVDKKVPYRKIAEDTGASTATITRVARWLHHGLGGYRMMLDRIN